MNKIYICDTGALIIDGEGNPKNFKSDRESINRIVLLDDDVEVVYSKNGKTKTLTGSKGQILIQFYESEFENPIVIVDNEEWKTNLENYRKHEEEMKAKWAQSKTECGDCDLCGTKCAA